MCVTFFNRKFEDTETESERGETPLDKAVKGRSGQQERETGQLLYIERRVNCKQTEDTETGKQREMRQGRIAKKKNKNKI